MKAVILLGGMSNWLYPLSHETSRAMLPIGNAPALSHLLELLSRYGVSDVYIPLPQRMADVRRHFGDGGGALPAIHYRDEKKYLGTAGSLPLFEEALGDAPFLIVNGNSYLQIDLSPILVKEPSPEPFFVVGVQPSRCSDCAGALRSHDAVYWERCHCSLAHVYYAHPGILAHVPKNKYFDLREQLIPLLITRGCDIRGVPLEGTVNPLRSFQDYLRANCDATLGAAAKHPSSSRIAESASIHGPLIMGENATIGPDAVVVGPAVIGRDSHIGRGAFLHQSVVSANVHVGEESLVRQSVLLDGARVKPASRLRRTVAFNGVQLPRGHRSLLRLQNDDTGWEITTSASALEDFARHGAIWEAAKRGMDLAAAVFVGPVAGAICLALGLVHKLLSPGPILYKETRMTKDGREFMMLKLRTMRVGAHLEQESFREKNESDGPMFKILHDPRITPMGHWLRKTSLDELPQFWNLLKGEMSLVGPRPLADREMRWHPAWREIRLRVKPGLTGPWQVWCGITSDFSSWIAYDTYYVQHASLWLDIRLILETILMVFKGRSPK